MLCSSQRRKGHYNQLLTTPLLLQYLALATHSNVTSLLPATTLVFCGGMTMMGAVVSDGSVAPVWAERATSECLIHPQTARTKSPQVKDLVEWHSCKFHSSTSAWILISSLKGDLQHDRFQWLSLYCANTLFQYPQLGIIQNTHNSQNYSQMECRGHSQIESK